MKKLLNTLYVTIPDTYLSLDGENIVIRNEEKILGRYPLHNLEAVCTFGYAGVSPALMGACVKRNIAINFMTHSGRFLARGDWRRSRQCAASQGTVPHFG
jgi:CRISPR-associated protein Cas1